MENGKIAASTKFPSDLSFHTAGCWNDLFLMQSQQLLREENKDQAPDKESSGDKKNLSKKWNRRMERRK